VVDPSYLQDITDGDPTLTATLVDLFLGQAGGQVHELARGVAAGDAASVASVAHTLKGSASAVGAQRIAAAASRLGDAGHSGDLSGATRLQSELELALRATRSILAPRSPEVA
jgi:HPt (histidine-containing phosphotransfer) domain-containing protein